MPPVPTRQQIINYGAQQARRVGLSPSWFLAMLDAESGFNPGAKSPAGAVGLGQLMPGTARGLNVNPYDWKQNIIGSARYFKAQYDQFKSYPLALSAYNSGPGGSEASGRVEGFAETQRYVERVSQLEAQYRDLGGVPMQQAAAAVGTGAVDGGVAAQSAAPDAPPPSGVYLDALTRLGPLSARVAKEAARFEPRAQAAPTVGAASQEQTGAFQPQGTGTQTGSPAAISKWLTLPTWGHASGAAEPGRPILSFAAGIARAAGTKLQVWDTTGHDQYTTNGTVSAHWSGNALDLPASGDELIRLGRVALMRAGMPRKEAMKAGPGLYNIGGYQIIFGTNDPNLGGDHTDHLHVGIRVQRERRGGQ